MNPPIVSAVCLEAKQLQEASVGSGHVGSNFVTSEKQRLGWEKSCKSSDPNNPCMAYLLTFTIKNQPKVDFSIHGWYEVCTIPKDPMLDGAFIALPCCLAFGRPGLVRFAALVSCVMSGGCGGLRPQSILGAEFAPEKQKESKNTR